MGHNHSTARAADTQGVIFEFEFEFNFELRLTNGL
jgi:hypothetical protein